MSIYYCELTGGIFHLCPKINISYFKNSTYSSVYSKKEKVFYCEKCLTSIPFALTFGLKIHKLQGYYKIGDYPSLVDNFWINKYSKFHLIKI